MNTLFDETEPPPAAPADAKFEKYKRDFYAAGGTLICNDDDWLRMMMTFRTAKDVAHMSRWIMPHNFDTFVRGILKRGRL